VLVVGGWVGGGRSCSCMQPVKVRGHQRPNHTIIPPHPPHPTPPTSPHHATQAVSFIRTLLRQGNTPQQVALALVDECLARDTITPASQDNITVLIVAFEAAPAAALAHANAPAGSEATADGGE